MLNESICMADRIDIAGSAADEGKQAGEWEIHLCRVPADVLRSGTS